MIVVAMLLLLPVAVHGQSCTETEGSNCHRFAYCDAGVCTCPEGILGGGSGEDGCSRDAWSVRFNVLLPFGVGVTNGKLDSWEYDVVTYAEMLTVTRAAPPGFLTSMHHEVSTGDGTFVLTVNALFPTPEWANDARKDLAMALTGPLPDQIADDFNGGLCPTCCPRVGDPTEGIRIDPTPVVIYGPQGQTPLNDDNSAGFTILATGDDDEFCDDCVVGSVPDLGFDFCVFGQQARTQTFVNSNSYVSWFSGSTDVFNELWLFDTAEYPSIMAGGQDLEVMTAAYLAVTESGKQGMVIRFEGRHWTEWGSGLPEAIWEMTLFDDNTVRVVNVFDTVRGGTTGRPGYGGLVEPTTDTVLVSHDWSAAQAAWLYSSAISAWHYPEELLYPMVFGLQLSPETYPIEARVYAWTAATTDAPLAIKPTGMNIDSVSFSSDCSVSAKAIADSGCWVVEISYSTGEDNFNTFFLPNAVGDEELSVDFDYSTTNAVPWSVWDKPASDTFFPSNFPCGSSDYDPSAPHDKSSGQRQVEAPPDKVSSCCIPQFMDLYRPIAEFSNWMETNKYMTLTKEACDAGFVYSFARPGYTGPVVPVGPFAAEPPIALLSCPPERQDTDLPENVLSFKCYDLDAADGTHGYISHGNQYETGTLWTWKLSAEAGQTITLRFNHLMTEHYWDYLRVQACGDAACTPALRTEVTPWLSGSWVAPFELEVCSQWALVSFQSDGFCCASNGFGLEYYMHDNGCPINTAEENARIPSANNWQTSSAEIYNGVLTVQGFDTDAFEVPPPPAMINPTAAPIVMPANKLAGKFRGMDKAWVEFKGIVDPYIRQYQATLFLDEEELRQKAGMLSGTVGVEHTVDTFIGLANFKPTGLKFLDSFATQVALHFEKTSFFTVASHGSNDYTFLQYVNLRLVAVYNQDTDFSETSSEQGDRTTRTVATGAAHYVQVTFTLGAQYQPIETGLVPSDSVRVSKGTFISSAATLDTEMHACQLYKDGSLEEQTTLDERLDLAVQPCGPGAVMCENPAQITDQFVSFNIPLGIDWLPSATSDLSENVFVDMVVSVIDTVEIGMGSTPNAGGPAHQMKTTLTASIPVVEGGVNIFCDGITAKTDLKDVVDADIIVGSAATEAELSRLTMLLNVASSELTTVETQTIATDSIESGLLTLVIRGNATYFGQPGTQTYGVQLEDVITIHVMEPEDTTFNAVVALVADPGDDNASPTGLDTDGYDLNGAFTFSVDRANNRAYLEPTEALLDLCPFSPPLPSPADPFPTTCVLRRDVRKRAYPARNGADATAIELDPAVGQFAVAEAGRVDNGEFMQRVLGASEYAEDLGRKFSQLVAQKYLLDGRSKRAFWINPGYEWTPTQTGPQSIFTLSQKLLFFALINLDESLTPASYAANAANSNVARRRMLLSSTKDTGAGVSGGVFAFESSLASVAAASMDADGRIGVMRMGLALSEEEACMAGAEQRAALTSRVAGYVMGEESTVASAVDAVHVVSVQVDLGPVTCPSASERRRRAMLAHKGRGLLAAAEGATAGLELLVVFAEGEEAMLDVEMLSGMSGVTSASLISSPAGMATDAVKVTVVQLDDEGKTYVEEEDDDEEDEESAGGMSMGDIGAIVGAVGGVALLAVIVFGSLAVYRRRQQGKVAEARRTNVVVALQKELEGQVKEQAMRTGSFGGSRLDSCSRLDSNSYGALRLNHLNQVGSVVPCEEHSRGFRRGQALSTSSNEDSMRPMLKSCKSSAESSRATSPMQENDRPVSAISAALSAELGIASVQPLSAAEVDGSRGKYLGCDDV